MSKKFFALATLTITIFVVAFLLKNESYATSFIWNLSNEGNWLLPLVAIAAFIDSVNPCAFSVLILTIAFLLSIGKFRSGIIKIGTSYVIGIFIVYMLIGLGTLRVLHLFNTPHFMARAGAVLLVMLGVINLINEFFSTFPVKLSIPKRAHHKIAELMEKASVPTAFILGGLVGLCEFPCTGGPYLMVLGLLYDRATYFKGIGYLVLYNLIFILPLAVILFLASDGSLIEKVQLWQKKKKRFMRLSSGIAMIMLGIIIFLI